MFKLFKPLSRFLKPGILAVILPLGASAAPGGIAPAGLATVPAPTIVTPVNSHNGMQYGACFYSRYNYRGSKICYGPNEFHRLPHGLNQHFRSIRLYGDVRVSLCSRKGLRGKCTGYGRSVRQLPRALANQTYSLRIYRPREEYDHAKMAIMTTETMDRQ